MVWSRLSKLLPWLILAAGLAITWQLREHEQKEVVLNLQTEFDFLVREAAGHVEQRMKTYEQVLRGTQGFFAADSNMRRADFRTYIATLKLAENYPGIQGMSFAPVVPQAQKDKHITFIRQQGFPAYTIQPEGQRDTYAPVIYIEPFSGRNLHAFGFDNYAEPSRRAAIERARDTGQAAITGKIKLAQEGDNNVQSGLLMFLPVYKGGAPIDTLAARRANIIGWVSAAFRMDDLMHGIYGEHTSLIEIEIYDGEEMSAQTLMNDSCETSRSRSGARFQTIKPLEIAGHTWTVAFRSLADFETRMDGEKLRIIAIAGLAASLLLFLITWLLVTSRQRAIKAAKVMSRELMESEARSREITSTMGEGVYVLNQNGLIIFSNPALQKMLGWTEAELLDQKAHDLYHHSKRDGTPCPEDLCEITLAMRASQPFRSDNETFWRKDGHMLPVSVSASPIIREGQMKGSVGVIHDITERTQAETEREQYFKFFNTSTDLMCIADPNGCFKKINPAFTQLLGYSEAELLARPFIEFVHPDDQQSTLDEMARQIQRGFSFNFENRYLCQDGSLRWLSWSAYINRDEGFTTYATARNVTERHKMEEELKESEYRWKFALEGAGDGVWDWNVLTGEVLFSKRWKEMLGFTESEIGNSFDEWEKRVHPEDKPHALANVQAYLNNQNDIYINEFRFLCKDNSWKWILARGMAVSRDADGKPLRIIGMHTDITERKSLENELREMATTDFLTGVYNRRHFIFQLEHEIARLQRLDTQSAGLLMIDLDYFKRINDSYGHATGDAVLKHITTLICDDLRKIDIFGRIGGEEFAIILPGADLIAAQVFAERMCQKIAMTSIQHNDLTITLTISVGITLLDASSTEADNALLQADQALYLAKESGRNNVKCYPTNLQDNLH